MIENLIQNGYWVDQNFLSPETVTRVQAEMAEFSKHAGFGPAGIGQHQRVEAVRGDQTHWWDVGALSSVQTEIFSKLEAIKNRLNEELFLGLWDFEAHYAIYPVGTFYKTHLDQFQNDDRRVLSVVMFFNSDWDINRDGGGLELESLSGEKIIISPSEGTLVCFLSEKIPHQVLETHRERKSLAGWFRKRARG